MIRESERTISAVPYALWRPGGEHTVKGNLFVLPDVHSPQLDNKRNVVVYLPPSYFNGAKRYPVIYAQDGQNLFDVETGFGGQEWQADEILEQLAADGIEAIMVGIWNTDKRLNEYTPFSNWWPATGVEYVRFIAETLKPQIDRQFRTLADKPNTGMLGSSLGGLISLWAFFAMPDVFGFVGAMSPAFWPGSGEIYRIVREAPFNPGRVYLDNGTREYSARPMYDLLKEKGYANGSALKYVSEKGGRHHEPAWARRLPDALKFLLR